MIAQESAEAFPSEASILDELGWIDEALLRLLVASGEAPQARAKAERMRATFARAVEATSSGTHHCRVGATHRPHTVYGGLHPPYECVNLARARYNSSLTQTCP